MQITSLPVRGVDIQPDIQNFFPGLTVVSHPPVSDNGIIKYGLKVVSFEMNFITLDGAIERLKNEGMSPAGISELRLIPRLDSLTRDYLLMAPASIQLDRETNQRFIPGLVENPYYRMIGKFYAEAGFSRGYKFLAL